MYSPPPSRWPRAPAGARLVVFEGWFHKVPAEDEAALAEPINALERDEDAQGTWRTYCNDALGRYAPLWARLDTLTWLRGPGFEVVPGWRWQQELTLQAAHPGQNIGLYVWADWCPICKTIQGTVNGLTQDHPVITVAMP